MAKKKSSAHRPTKLHQKSHLITWVVFVALLLGLVGGYLFAKAKYVHKIGIISEEFSQKDTKLNKMKAKMGKMNQVWKKDGQVWVIKDGDIMLLEEEMTLPNGIKVQPSGEYMMPGQDVMMLAEGEALDENGNVVTEEEYEAKF